MKNVAFALALVCMLGLVSCSNTSSEDATGTITFYSEAVKEFTDPISAVSIELSKEQAGKIEAILNNIQTWIDDSLTDRLAFYFDGEFKLSSSEFVYYFSYEHNVIYYDHYFSEIATEEMQFIKDLSIAS